MSTSLSDTLDARVVLELRIVGDDGWQQSRVWTWGEAKQPGGHPDPSTIEIQPWMRDPRKTWAHPQDPIVFSALVDDADRDAAVAWLDSFDGGERR